MRWTPVAGLTLALTLALAPTAPASPVLTLSNDGSVRAGEDPYLPPDRMPAVGARGGVGTDRMPRAAAAQRRPRRTVRGELARMLRAGAIDQATHDRHRATYARARSTRAKLRGARRVAMDAVLDNLEDVAAGGLLTVSRLPALFETVARNRQWWANGPLLANGRRVTFSGSRLVWQHYTGQGLQLQWLGTFGKANGLFQARTQDVALRELLDEAVGLAAERAGGIAFEYLFRFGGGRPPWASGMAQGTAVQALSRAAVRLDEPRFFGAARAALGIFRTAPPQGVRVDTGNGAHYLIYSYAPSLRVLNGFVQALNGLHDFAVLANDAEGRALFSAGDDRLRAELGSYDTGGWSRYSNRRDSDLGYHKLLRDFLRNLCGRLTDDLRRPGGGPKPGADPGPYCAMAQRFTEDLSRDPKVALVSRRVRAGRPASVRLVLDKPAFVTLSVRRAGRTVVVLRDRLDSGVRSLRWARPRGRGQHQVAIRATDLAGNDASATGALDLLKAK